MDSRAAALGPTLRARFIRTEDDLDVAVCCPSVVFKRRFRSTRPDAIDRPAVLIALEPRLFAQALGQLVEQAGFRVVAGDPAGDELAGDGWDALVVRQGTSVRDGGVVVAIGTNGTATVTSGGETGLTNLEHPSDVVGLLRALLAPEPDRTI